MSDHAQYCRDIETHLCQKNEGHLIRIVGPAFEKVCGWAERGVPLKIAFRGIDRYCERYYAKPGRRRPVRIEFCEADILEAFDEWRRAVGVVAAGPGPDTDVAAATGRTPSLSAHIERAMARLRSLGSSGTRSPEFLARVGAAARELEAMAPAARGARGKSRERMVEQLAALDLDLLTAALSDLDPKRAAGLKEEADTELAPFGARMPPDARERAYAAAFHRLVREALGVPTLTYE
jgi:hypothetical protein